MSRVHCNDSQSGTRCQLRHLDMQSLDVVAQKKYIVATFLTYPRPPQTINFLLFKFHAPFCRQRSVASALWRVGIMRWRLDEEQVAGAHDSIQEHPQTWSQSLAHTSPNTIQIWQWSHDSRSDLQSEARRQWTSRNTHENAPRCAHGRGRYVYSGCHIDPSIGWSMISYTCMHTCILRIYIMMFMTMS